MNDDLISRQAVNEIINDIRDCISVEGYCAILERLKKLPSVNPQPCEYAISRQSAILLANDLKQDLPDDERIADMVMARNEGILEYQTQLSLLPPVNPQEPKWTPVSERLPEEDDFYLVTAKVGNELIIDISEYTPKNDFWDIPHEIVAWLPLPKPYEPQESEG